MPSQHLDIAVESEIDGNSAAAYDHLVELFYNELDGLPCIDSTRHLFRFSSIPANRDVDFSHNPLIQDIQNDALTLSNPKKFNDPMDPILWEWLKINECSESNSKYRKIFKMGRKIMEKNLRICCLVAPVTHFGGSNSLVENCNPLMWAHYANSHKGICIEYEITPESLKAHNDKNHILRLCDVRYKNHKIMSNSITLDNALLAKGDYWEYEKESRLIYYTKDKSEWLDSSGKVKDHVTLNGFKVKAVYMGYRIPENDSNNLKKLLSNKGIDLYKMDFSRDDITRLVSKNVK